jgi:hypothetical protein
MNFVILNSSFFPIPRTHYLHVKKFSVGFAQLGYNIIETDSIGSLIELNENDIVYISNHFYVDLYFKFSRNSQLKYLSNILNKITCKVLMWNFHTIKSNYFFSNNSNWLFLTESYNQVHFMREDINQFYCNVNFYQLQYSSTKNDLIKYKEFNNFKFDFNFVGSPYNVDILNKIKNNKKLRSFIRIAPPVINEIERVNSFINSKFNLVFHSEGNKLNGVVTERFAEALSYGNILIHDNQKISEYISELPGCKYIESYEDIIEICNYFNNLNPHEITEIVNKNREYWKNSQFSYRKQALNIVKLLK